MLFATKSQNKQASEQLGPACSFYLRKNLRISVTTQPADKDTAGPNELRAALLSRIQSLQRELQVEKFQSERMTQSTAKALTMRCAKRFSTQRYTVGVQEV